MGLSIAHELAHKGLQIEVLSRRRNEAAGFVAAGMLAPHAEGLSEKLLTLGQISLSRIPNWVHRIEHNSGINCELRFCGIVVPFLSSNERNNYPTAQFGKPLNRVELSQEVPGIGSNWESGLLFTKDGQIDNRRLLMRALEKACVEKGVHFQEGTEVLELITKSDGFAGVHIRDAEGLTKKIYAKQAVLCSGAWSNQLLPQLPIFPIKGQMLSIQGPKDALPKIIFGPGIYLVPREDGLIVVGATSEKNAGFNEGCTPFGQQQLQKGLNSLLPCAKNWPHMDHWWGFRPCTPDQSPIIGESFIKGLWLATGHHRNGVLLAAITSELIAKYICKQPLNSDEEKVIRDFRWDRFDKGNKQD